MNNEWLKCPYCDFEQVNDSSKKEIICKKCRKTYTEGAGANYYLKYKGYYRDASNDNANTTSKNDVKIEGLHFSEEERKKLEIEWEEKIQNETSATNKQSKEDTTKKNSRSIGAILKTIFIVYFVLSILYVLVGVGIQFFAEPRPMYGEKGIPWLLDETGHAINIFSWLKDKEIASYIFMGPGVLCLFIFLPNLAGLFNGIGFGGSKGKKANDETNKQLVKQYSSEKMTAKNAREAGDFLTAQAHERSAAEAEAKLLGMDSSDAWRYAGYRNQAAKGDKVAGMFADEMYAKSLGNKK